MIILIGFLFCLCGIATILWAVWKFNPISAPLGFWFTILIFGSIFLVYGTYLLSRIQLATYLLP